MKTEDIKQVIRDAIVFEQQSLQLTRHLNALKNGLHPLLGLDQEQANETLMEFVLQYIHHVPEFIRVMDETCNTSELTNFVRPFSNRSAAFVLSPPSIVEQLDGLDGLMHKAYLSHRLIEEVNEIFWSIAGYPLMPFDTNQANVIIHSIIGEPFANALDLEIEKAVVELSPHSQDFNTDEVRHHLQENAQRWKNSSEEWPCLAGQLGMDLKLRQFYLYAV